jgi:hypothetical protein
MYRMFIIPWKRVENFEFEKHIKTHFVLSILYTIVFGVLSIIQYKISEWFYDFY